MKGQMKPSTRFDRFRKAILAKFVAEYPVDSLISFLKIRTDISYEIAENNDGSGMTQSAFQILRLTNRPVLLRDLELFASVTWPKWSLASTKNAFYTALSVLYSTNLIDYTFRDVNSKPSDVILFFVKDDEL